MLKEIEQIEITLDDPLLVSTPLPLRAVFYPRGFPLEIHTNSKDVLTAAQESWGMYRQEFFERPVEIRVGVAGNTAVCSAVPVFRSQRHLLSMVSDSETFGLCDLSKGFGYCWTTPGTAKNRPFFRYHFLEGIPTPSAGPTVLDPNPRRVRGSQREGLVTLRPLGNRKIVVSPCLRPRRLDVCCRRRGRADPKQTRSYSCGKSLSDALSRECMRVVSRSAATAGEGSR